MKIMGTLVDLLVRIAPETYGKYVVTENGKRVVYSRDTDSVPFSMGSSTDSVQLFARTREERTDGFVVNPNPNPPNPPIFIRFTHVFGSVLRFYTGLNRISIANVSR